MSWWGTREKGKRLNRGAGSAQGSEGGLETVQCELLLLGMAGSGRQRRLGEACKAGNRYAELQLRVGEAGSLTPAGSDVFRIKCCPVQPREHGYPEQWVLPARSSEIEKSGQSLTVGQEIRRIEIAIGED